MIGFIKSIIAEWKFLSDCERKKQEWYRNEIIAAIERGDYALAEQLRKEMERPWTNGLIF